MNVENFITAWCIKSNKKKIRFLSLFVCVCVCVCLCVCVFAKSCLTIF